MTTNKSICTTFWISCLGDKKWFAHVAVSVLIVTNLHFQSCRLLEKMDLEECVLITDATLIHLAMGCPRLEKLVSHHYVSCIICHILTLPSNSLVLHCYCRSMLRRSCVATKGLGNVRVDAMKVCGRNECTAPLILNLLGGGECSASCPGHFTTGEITPDIYRTGPV